MRRPRGAAPSSASRTAGCCVLSSIAPLVVGRPATSIRSFTPTGTPVSGPAGTAVSPESTSPPTCTNALSAGFSLRTRSSSAARTPSADSLPALTRVAIVVADAHASSAWLGKSSFGAAGGSGIVTGRAARAAGMVNGSKTIAGAGSSNSSAAPSTSSNSSASKREPPLVTSVCRIGRTRMPGGT